MRFVTCLISLFLLIAVPRPGYTECIEQYDIAVWPDEHSTATIQPRQLFLFSAGRQRHAAHRALLDFGRQIQMYLWSKHDSVPLLLLEQPANPLSSDLQVLMQPARPLLPDTVYHLRTSLPPAGYSLFRMQRAQPGSKQLIIALHWRVSSAPPDVQAPRWMATPVVLHRKYSENSEGIDNFVQFSYPMLDASPVLVRATIRSERQEKPIVSYLTSWQNQLGVGWFTCGGNFTFWPDEACTVTFEALDAAGNRSSASGRPIPFRGPTWPQRAATDTGP